MRLLIIAVLAALALTGCEDNNRKTGSANKAGTSAGVSDSTQFTSIEWLDSANKNFGRIAEGQKLQVAFRFKNTGDKPLIIQKVQPSCGCTIAEQPNEPIMPGKEGEIKASFNSEGRTGPNHKTLYVFANTKGTHSHELHFEVEVEKKKW
jgi:hypothetical protein